MKSINSPKIPPTGPVLYVSLGPQRAPATKQGFLVAVMANVVSSLVGTYILQTKITSQSLRRSHTYAVHENRKVLNSEPY